MEITKNKLAVAIRGGVSTAVAIGLLAGCSAKKVEPIQNKSIGHQALYVGYNSTQHKFTSISNTLHGKGFRLNDYKPFNFNEKITTGKKSLWNSDFEKSKEYYQSIQWGKINYKKDKLGIAGIVGETFFYTLYGPYFLALGVIVSPLWAIDGFSHDQTKYFDYPRFDKDVKDWVAQNNIDRQLLLTNYYSLYSLSLEKQNLIQTQRNKHIKALNNMYKLAQKQYAKSPIIHKIYKDKSGLYKNEVLSKEVFFIKNTIPTKHFSYPSSFKYYVDIAFPCNSQKSCMKRIDTAKIKLNQAYNKDKKTLTERTKASSEKYAKRLKEVTQFIEVNAPKNIITDNFLNKSIHYKIITQNKVLSTAKNLNVTYQIDSVDYSNIFPSFNNENKDISLSFDKKTKELKLTNNTDEFIQINSVSLYYNSAVYVVTDSAKSNYSTELSPKSSSTIEITQHIPQSNYTNITKAKALNTKLKFGFAVKYTIGSSSNKKTMYKTQMFILYPLIKNIKGPVALRSKTNEENFNDNIKRTMLIAYVKGYARETRAISLGKFGKLNRSYIANHCEQGSKDYKGKEKKVFYDYCKKFALHQ